MTRPARQGFVLLAVLWILVGVSVTALGLALLARRAARSAANRRDEIEALWIAEDCAQRVQAVMAQVLVPRAADAAGGPPAWRDLDRALAVAPLLAAPPVQPRGRCRTVLQPSGRAIDINTADAELLWRAFRQLGVPAGRADSLVDAVMDWRDADQVPRPHGAEEAWYVGQGRAPPRDGPFADIRELARVRGLEHVAGLDSMFGVDPGRIVLDRAPLAVIAALPGFSGEAVARVAEHRLRGAPVGDLLALGAELSPGARDAFLARYPDLVRLTTAEPEAWTLTVGASVGLSPITTVLEERFVRAGARAALVRRRTWVE